MPELPEEAPITPAQIRGARAMIDWSQDRLAEAAGVGLTTVRDLEKARRSDSAFGIGAIARALRNEGVIFLSSDGREGPGVRILTRWPNVLRSPIKLGRFDELQFPVEWRGRSYTVLLSQEILDDIGQFTATQSSDAYVRLFENNRNEILIAAALALDAGRAGADRRVVLEHDDFERFRRRGAPTIAVKAGAVGIDEVGFLSPDVAPWMVKHHADHARWFTMAEQLNRIGQRLLGRSKITVDGAVDDKLLAMLLFTRALSNFQGALLMAERGMIVEARTLGRTCLETTFCLAAMVKGNKKFVEKMLYHELYERRAKANWLLNARDRRRFIADDSAQRLKDYVRDVERSWESLAKLGFEEMAKQGGMHEMYIWYRELSGDAAHPTVSSLSRYISDERGQESEVRWGPNCNSAELGDTLNLICNFLLAANVAFNEVVDDSEIGAELVGAFQAYKSLNDIRVSDDSDG